MITGEPLPVLRQAGEAVIGGTLNVDGRLLVRVTKVGSETALAQIIRLVDAAQSSKPPVQRLADRVAAVFVPAVLIIALLTALGWYAVGVARHWESAHLWGQMARAVCSGASGERPPVSGSMPPPDGCRGARRLPAPSDSPSGCATC